MVGSLGLSCRYKRFLPCLGCPSRPSSKYSPYTSSILLSHRSASWAGSRAASPFSQYVSLIVSLLYMYVYSLLKINIQSVYVSCPTLSLPQDVPSQESVLKESQCAHRIPAQVFCLLSLLKSTQLAALAPFINIFLSYCNPYSSLFIKGTVQRDGSGRK